MHYPVIGRKLTKMFSKFILRAPRHFLAVLLHDFVVAKARSNRRVGIVPDNANEALICSKSKQSLNTALTQLGPANRC